MFFRSMGIFLHVIFLRFVPMRALRTTNIEMESIESRAGCKSCGLVHLDKTLSLSWSMFPPSPIPGQRSWSMSWSQVVFFSYKKMCFRSFKRNQKALAAKEIKSCCFFSNRSALFPRNLFVLGETAESQCGARFFSQEIRAKKWGPTRIQYLLLLLTKSLCVLG